MIRSGLKSKERRQSRRLKRLFLQMQPVIEEALRKAEQRQLSAHEGEALTNAFAEIVHTTLQDREFDDDPYLKGIRKIIRQRYGRKFLASIEGRN